MNLSDNERTELVAFLKTLTDKDFLFNPKYAYPK
jgi:cytochrome c peroxidase